jgi:hypothetical protein
MEISTTIDGIPLHPLVVHAAVVLVPLAALTFIFVGWNRSWRRAYYLPVTLLALAGGLAAFLADQTGEPLEESVRSAGEHVGEHPEQGQTAMIFGMLLAGACVAVFLLHRFGDRIRERTGLDKKWRLPVDMDTILYALVVPVALVAIFTMVVAGHSGAKLVWQNGEEGGESGEYDESYVPGESSALVTDEPVMSR